MTRCILDTHILVWFLENDKRLPESIREDIEYMQHRYCVSVLTLLEIDNLQKLKKINLQYTIKEILEQLQESCIDVLFDISAYDLDVLYNLDMKTINGKTHGDYIDRAIISLAISSKYTMISADTKFPHYINSGLRLIEI